MVVDRFVGTAGDLSWRARVAQDKLRSKSLRYLDLPQVAKRWEELTGAAYICDAPMGECATCGGCKA